MRTRSLRAVASAAVLTAGVVLLPAAPAAAASGITSPGDGEILAAHAVVPIRAVVDGPAVRASELSLQAPGSDAPEVVAVQTSPDGGELTYDFDTSCAGQLCSGGAPAVNGTWTVRLSGAASDERVFVLRIPPAAPSEVAAAPAESGVVVRWRIGAEPDLTGYAVEDGQGRTIRAIGLDACDAEGTCRVELPEDGAAWSVRAFRAACPGCPDQLASIASETVRVGSSGSDGVLAPELAGGNPGAGPGAASPDPARAPDGPDQRSAFARAFGPGLPASGPAPADAQAPAPRLPDGTYDPTLGYVAPPDAGSGAASRAQGALDSAVAGDRTSLVIASVLLVGVAWWLRRWARRAIAE